MRRILDANYKKADKKVITEQCQHLIPSKRESLMNLKKIEYLFDRTLGTWNTALVDLELKDDVNPVCLQPYPVLRVHKEMFRKESERLVKLGVLKEENDSEWGAPSFAEQIAKTSWITSLSDFRNLNRHLKRKTYPIPKIWEMLLNLEGFKYATSLELDMGYYHMLPSEESSNLFTIILTWVKYKYKHLPMGVCKSPENY